MGNIQRRYGKNQDTHGQIWNKHGQTIKIWKVVEIIEICVGFHPAILTLFMVNASGRWRAAGQSCSVDAVNWDDVDSVVYVAGGMVGAGSGTVRFSEYT